MTAYLREQGYEANHKPVGRLLRLMGIEAIYPKPRLSLAAPGYQIYPYLLCGVKTERVNQVWSADITYFKFHYTSFLRLVRGAFQVSGFVKLDARGKVINCAQSDGNVGEEVYQRLECSAQAGASVTYFGRNLSQRARAPNLQCNDL